MSDVFLPTVRLSRGLLHVRSLATFCAPPTQRFLGDPACRQMLVAFAAALVPERGPPALRCRTSRLLPVARHELRLGHASMLLGPLHRRQVVQAASFWTASRFSLRASANQIGKPLADPKVPDPATNVFARILRGEAPAVVLEDGARAVSKTTRLASASISWPSGGSSPRAPGRPEPRPAPASQPRRPRLPATSALCCRTQAPSSSRSRTDLPPPRSITS